MKITREEIEAIQVNANNGEPDYSHEDIGELCKLALVGLQVEESTVQARETAKKIIKQAFAVGPCHIGSLQRTDIENQAAQLISLYAVGQGRKADLSDSREHVEESGRVGGQGSMPSIINDGFVHEVPEKDGWYWVCLNIGDTWLKPTPRQIVLGLEDYWVIDPLWGDWKTHARWDVLWCHTPIPQVADYSDFVLEDELTNSTEPLSDPTKQEDASPSPTHPAAPHGDSLGEVVWEAAALVFDTKGPITRYRVIEIPEDLFEVGDIVKARITCSLSEGLSGVDSLEESARVGGQSSMPSNEGGIKPWKLLVSPQPTYIASSGRWVWPIPKDKLHPGCCTDVCTASREWWEYLQDDQKPIEALSRVDDKTVSHVIAEHLTFDYESEAGAWFWVIHFVDSEIEDSLRKEL